MPFTITTKDGITIRNIPDDIASDADVLKQRVAEIREQSFQEAPTQEEVPPAITQTLPPVEQAIQPATQAPSTQTTEQPGFFRTLRGEAELGTSILATGLLEVPAGVAGIVQSLNPLADPDAGAQAVEAIRSLAFKPREAGIEVAKSIGEIVKDITPEFVQDFIKFTGEKFSEFQEAAFQRYGPIAGTAVAIAPVAVLEAIPGFFALKKARGLKTTVADEVIEQAEDSARAQAEKSFKAEIQPEAKTYENIKTDITKENTQNIIQAVNPDPEILKSAQALGVDLNPSHYSTNRAFIEMEQGLKSKPGSTLSTVEQQAILRVGEEADKLITDLGGSIDKSLLDANVRGDIEKSIASLEIESTKAYNSVSKAIPKSTKITPEASKSFIENRLIDLGGDKKLLSQAEQQLSRIISAKDNPTYGALDQVRKNVGSALGKKSGPFKDDDSGILSQIYGVLSNDQQGIADSFGVGADYELGRKLVSTRKGIEKEAVKLFKKDMESSFIPQLGVAAKQLTKGDISTFQKLMKALPKNRRPEAAATMLNEFFASAARKKGAISGGFVSAFESLNRNPGAKKIIFDELPQGAQKRFDDIGRVATGIFNAKALENVSGTARSILASLDDGSLIQKILQTRGGKIGLEVVGTTAGAPGVGTAVGIGGDLLSRLKGPKSKSASEFLTSPGFKKSLEDAALGNRVSAENIQKTSAFKNWVNQQAPDIKTEIAAIGFIPWLLQDRPETAE